MDLDQLASEFHYNLSKLLQWEFNCFVSSYCLTRHSNIAQQPNGLLSYNSTSDTKVIVIVEQYENSHENVTNLIDRDGNEKFFGYHAFVTAWHSGINRQICGTQHTFELVVNDFESLNKHLSEYLYTTYSEQFDKLMDETLQS